MAGIQLFQANGAGTVNAAGAAHPVPVTIDTGMLCQLSFVGGTTDTYRWVFTRPGGSSATLSSATSAGPSFMPDILGASYSISLFDEDENQYILDIVTPTAGIPPGGGGGGSLSSSYTTYSSVRAPAAIPSTPPNTIMLQCRDTEDDGAGGLFAYDSADTTTPDNDGTVLVGANGERYKRIFAGALDLRWFGGIGDNDPANAAANTSAFEAAFDTMTQGGELSVFPGAYHFSAEIHITRPIILRGVGMSKGIGYYAPTIFVFPHCSAGIVIEYQAGGTLIEDLALSGTEEWTPLPFPFDQKWTKWAPGESYDVGDVVIPPEWTFRGYALRCIEGGTSAGSPGDMTGEPAGWHDWAQYFPSTGPGGPWTDGTVTWETISDASGVVVQASGCTLRRLYIRAFPCNGIYNVSGPEPSLPDLTQIDNCFAVSCGQHGSVFLGDDSNVCRSDQFNAISCGGFAIQDSSFLGNMHVAAHARDNHGGCPFYLKNAAGLAEELYSEGGQGAADISGQRIGGFFGAGNADALAHFRRAPWGTGQTITTGDTRAPTTPNGYYYRAANGGTTHASTEPTWPLGCDRTVTDNGITWVCYGLYNGFKTHQPQNAQLSTSASYVVFSNPENTDDVRFTLGGPPGATAAQSGVLRWQYFDTAGIGKDIWSMTYVPGVKKWTLENNFTTNYSIAWYETSSSLDSRVTYFPCGVGVGRNHESGGADLYARLFSATAPNAAIAHEVSDVVFNAEPAFDEPFAWRCITAGTPGVFEPVYASSLIDISRVARGTPWFSDATEWAINDDGHAVAQVNTDSFAYWVLDVPQGSLIGTVTAFLSGTGHSSLPASMPILTVHDHTISTNGTSTAGTATDSSASTGAYDAAHVIEAAVAITVENSDHRYIAILRNEHGADAQTGLDVYMIMVTFTPAAPDRGAA